MYLVDKTAAPFPQTVVGTPSERLHKYETRSVRNTCPPKLGQFREQLSEWFDGKYSWKSKQIHVPPELGQWGRLPPTLKAFLDTLWWTWVIVFGCRQLSMYMGEIISRFPQVWCIKSDSIWPLLFLQPLSEGHRTRLTIRSKSKYHWWWDEQACLDFWTM